VQHEQVASNRPAITIFVPSLDPKADGETRHAVVKARATRSALRGHDRARLDVRLEWRALHPRTVHRHVEKLPRRHTVWDIAHCVRAVRVVQDMRMHDDLTTQN
jgi:hypothetical protein